jgi:hypothetical protein
VTKLQELNLRIEYIPGQYNTVADFLSRQPAVSPKCSVCSKVIFEYDPDSVTPLTTPIAAAQFDVAVLDLTDDLQRQKIAREEAHDSPQAAHPGIWRTTEKIERLYTWPSLRSDVHAYVRSCDSCQRNKPRNCKPLGLLQSLPVPTTRFTCVGMDWFCLPRDKSGFDCVMIIVDYFTKFTVLIPCKTTDSSTTMAELFKRHWIERGFGIPSILISDRDTKLTSRFWHKLCTSLRINLQLATARHQQTNGQVERTIRTVKTTILSLLDYDTAQWRSSISTVEFALNDTVNATTGSTPFFLTLGQHPSGPHEVASSIHPWASKENQVRESIAKAHRLQARQYDRHRTPHSIKVGDLVLLERAGINWSSDQERSTKLLSPWLGPFTVLAVTPSNVTLDLPPTTKIHNVFSVSKVKPYVSRPESALPSPDFIDGAPEFEVERILDHQLYRKHRQFLVKWKHMGHERNQWLFEDDMVHCSALIRRYLETGGGVRSDVSRSGIGESIGPPDTSDRPRIRIKLRVP